MKHVKNYIVRGDNLKYPNYLPCRKLTSEFNQTVTVGPLNVFTLMLMEWIDDNRVVNEYHTLDILKEQGVQKGSGKQLLYGPTRQFTKQLKMETISRHTLKWALKRRREQIWKCAACEDPDAGDK